MDHRVRGVLLVAALSVLAACGGSTSDEPTATSPTPTSPTVTVPAEALQAKLLTEADVGSSWQLGHAVNDADFSDAMQLPCADAAINPTITARLTPTAGVQFDPVDHSNTHLMELARAGVETRLSADLDIFHEALAACAGRPAGGAGTDEAGTVDVAELAVPELGDQRFAVVLTGSAPADGGVTWFVRMATVRVGALAIDVRLTEILDAPSAAPRISDEAFVAIVELAAARLER